MATLGPSLGGDRRRFPADGRKPPICRRRRPFLRRRPPRRNSAAGIARRRGRRRQCGGAETRDHARAARGPTRRKRSVSPSLSPFGMVDVGAGYQATSWFRADATIDIASAQASARARLTPGQGGANRGRLSRRRRLVRRPGQRLCRLPPPGTGFRFPRRRSWLRRQPALERQREPPRVGRRLRLGLAMASPGPRWPAWTTTSPPG